MWIYGHKTCLHGQPQTAKNGTIPFSAAKDLRPFSTLKISKKTFLDPGYGNRTFSDVVQIRALKKPLKSIRLPFKG